MARNQVTPERSFWRVLLYILFFLHHQAGPIMRPATFLPQFHGRKAFDADLVASGGLWILWGLAKKVLADNLAVGVDAGFAHPGDVVGLGMSWALALRYALQIYGDFSGYSAIALGLGLLFGYRLDRNFDQPYLATDPAAFWRRWHITLSAWLRDYLYFPLGGNRLGPVRTYVNLMVTMVLGDLWHGASVMFLIWAFLHGLLLIAHRRLPRLFAIKPIGWLITFLFTVMAWVPFRSPDWATTKHLLAAMIGLHGVGGLRPVVTAGLWVGVVLAMPVGEDRVLHTESRRKTALHTWPRVPALVRGGIVGIGIVLQLIDHTTYIYFRF